MTCKQLAGARIFRWLLAGYNSRSGHGFVGSTEQDVEPASILFAWWPTRRLVGT